jgi:antitoxin component YwqK of YwqJK toxin-antitoxin module
VWKYYYDTGEKLKTVNYKDGIPFESFNIYRKDASLMISVIKQNSTWVVSKYSENGKIFEKKPGLIKDFEMLY